MKKSIVTFMLCFAAIFVFAQSEDTYVATMSKQIKSIGSAETVEAFRDLANNFERIANAETGKWHPLYYASLCYINMSFVSKEAAQKDSYLDKAQTYLDKALEIVPEESELLVLQGLLYEGRIQVDPISRGMNFSMKATEALNKAKEYNPDNPRAYYLLGMNVLYTPESFGGGAKAACPLFKVAADKFGKAASESALSPAWGGEENQKLFDTNCGSKE